MTGPTPWATVTPESPCVICGKSDWCARSPDGNAAICRRISDGATYAKKDKNGADYYVHRLKDGPGHPVGPPPKPKADPCPPALADKVYRALLAGIPLSDAHRANLRSRGLTEEEIERRGYGSFPEKGFSALARKLLDTFGEEVLRVPGFVFKDGEHGPYLTLAAAAGIAIPVRDLDGRVVANKIRGDDAGRSGRSGRYFYMSSAKQGGPGSGAPCHVPVGVQRRPDVLRITEGELKADVATARSGVPTVSTPGVSNWGAVLPIIAEIEPKVVRLAFDADSDKNKEVAQALLNLWKRIVDANYLVEIERWDASRGAKGIDDALAAGIAIDILAADDVVRELRRIAALHGLPFDEPRSAFRRVEVEGIGTVLLSIEAADADNRRRIIGVVRGVRHEDRFDAASAISRRRFSRALAKKAGVDEGLLHDDLDDAIQQQAAHSDRLEDEALSADDAEGNESGSQATLAFKIACMGELWRTPEPEAFTTIEVDGHLETWRVNSKAFKRYLAHQFFLRHQTALKPEALASAIQLAEAQAHFQGEERKVYVRVAEVDGRLYLDLCNKAWQAVEITSFGWKVVDRPSVRFRRSKGMQALPAPVRGGSMDELAALLNISPSDFKLVVGWLINSFFEKGPFPVLALFAQQGCGKSVSMCFIRCVVDPNVSVTRTQPRDPRDLVITASNSWVSSYDNLSHVPDWFSDCMCRVATGGGLATRELYSDAEEVIFDVKRPQILGSIEDVADRSDLLDRCLIIRLQPIPDNNRRTESELRETFEKVHAQIIGAALDGVVGALRELPKVKLEFPPRMADFAYRATAAERALGWNDGDFMVAYEANRESANDIALEASPIAGALLRLLDRGGWSGTATQLLAELEELAEERQRNAKKWPSTPRVCSGQLERLAPNLRRLGWLVERSKDPGKKRDRVIEIRRDPGFCVRTVRSVRVPGAEGAEPHAADRPDAADAKSGGSTPDRQNRTSEDPSHEVGNDEIVFDDESEVAE